MKRTFSTSVVSFKEDRHSHDLYPTDPRATKALLDHTAFDHRVWEPACGLGHISRILEERGHDVRSSDLVDYGYGEVLDFLKTPNERGDRDIVTNPPFNLAMEFLEKALAVTKRRVASFHRLAFLESQRRHTFFTGSPVRSVLVISDRVGIDGRGSMYPYCWIVWDLEHEGSPTIDWALGKRYGDRSNPVRESHWERYAVGSSLESLL